MNALEFAELLNDLPDDMIVPAAKRKISFFSLHSVRIAAAACFLLIAGVMFAMIYGNEKPRNSAITEQNSSAEITEVTAPATQATSDSALHSDNTVTTVISADTGTDLSAQTTESTAGLTTAQTTTAESAAPAVTQNTQKNTGHPVKGTTAATTASAATQTTVSETAADSTGTTLPVQDDNSHVDAAELLQKYQLGDIDMNGIVDLSDALIALYYYGWVLSGQSLDQKYSLTEEQLILGNVDGVERMLFGKAVPVDYCDAVFIQRYYTKTIAEKIPPITLEQYMADYEADPQEKTIFQLLDRPLGDITNDGLVDIQDAQLIMDCYTFSITDHPKQIHQLFGCVKGYIRRETTKDSDGNIIEQKTEIVDIDDAELIMEYLEEKTEQNPDLEFDEWLDNHQDKLLELYEIRASEAEQKSGSFTRNGQTFYTYYELTKVF
ncbi:MAG: hypothetical protein IKI58_03010 [Oscillospiraceae bacterium]|nr:hypothetical protein [Oscillospiraceae bacterium]